MSSWCIHELQRSKNSSQLQLCSSANPVGFGWLEMTWTFKICLPNHPLSHSGRAGWDLRLEEPPDPVIPKDLRLLMLSQVAWLTPAWRRGFHGWWHLELSPAPCPGGTSQPGIGISAVQRLRR